MEIELFDMIFCGNGICDENETLSLCPVDCAESVEEFMSTVAHVDICPRNPVSILPLKCGCDQEDTDTG